MSAPGIDPLDFLAIDRLLTDEERDIRDAVRAFVRSEILPGVGVETTGVIGLPEPAMAGA